MKKTSLPKPAAAADAIKLREDWLSRLSIAFQAEITARCGLAFPPVRVACGFPSRGGELGGKKRVAGQCWSAEASEDKHAEVFVSPVEAEAETVAAILAHELVHASIPEAGHGKAFQKAMKTLGHKAPFTQSIATDEFWAWVRPLLAKVGPYPHATLVAMRPVAAPKKQPTRMLKAVCEEVDGNGCACGFTVRLTRKWIEEVGAPLCPKHFAPMTCEGLGGGDEIEEDGDE